jgi:hypothetical protein
MGNSNSTILEQNIFTLTKGLDEALEKIRLLNIDMEFIKSLNGFNRVPNNSLDDVSLASNHSDTSDLNTI